MKINLRQLVIIALIGVGLSFTVFGTVMATKDEKVKPPLDRPSIISPLAPESVLLGIARAGDRLVAVGERGHIILSDDNGASWRQVVAPVSVTLTAVQFVTPKKGWAVGHQGVVLHSEDGGETWVMQLDGKLAVESICKSAQALQGSGQGSKEEIACALSAAQLMLNDGPDKPFLDLYFETEQKGFIVGAYNLIFRTEDGGTTWQTWLNHVDNPESMNLYGIRPLGKDIFIVGERGLILRSEDGGETFKRQSTPYDGSFFGLLPLTGGELLIFGLRGNAFWSGDRGATWEKIDTKSILSVTGATEMENGTVLLTLQSGIVLASTDKGRTFKELTVEKRFPFMDIAETSNNALVVVGVRGVTLGQNPEKLT